MTIRPGDGDDLWPLMDVPYSKTGATFRPDALVVTLTRGSKSPDISASGLKLKNDGTPSKNRANEKFWFDKEVPAWITELIEAQRRSNGLGPGATGTGW